MENTLKMKVELEELKEGVAIDVEMKGKCTAPIAEKVIISILDVFHDEAPISTLIAINRFIDKHLGVE